MIFGGAPWNGLPYQLGSGIIAAGDINGDGKDDLVQRLFNVPDLVTPDLEDIIPNMTLVFLGDLSAPSQTLIDIANIFPVGDLDGDGFDDAIVQPAMGVASYHLYFGSGIGYFPSTNGFTLPSQIGSLSMISSGDYNGDGAMDVLIHINGVLHVINGNSNRTLIQPTSLTLPTSVLELQSFRRSDSNRDFFAYLHTVPTVSISIFRMQDSAMVSVQVLNVGVTLNWWAFADLNADGRPDLVVGASNGNISWYPGLSPANATSSGTVFGTATPITRDAAILVNNVRPYSDLTGDGAADFIVTRNNETHIANGSTVLSTGLNPTMLVRLLDSGRAFNTYAVGQNKTNPSKSVFSFGDITRSGKDELIAVISVTNPSQFKSVAISNVVNGTSWTGVNLNAPVRESREEFHFGANTGDWDGDGRDDYGYAYNDFTPQNSRYRIVLSGGGELSFNFAPDFNFYGVPAFGDINGDGASDMLLRVQRQESGVLREYVDIYSAASSTKTDKVVSLSVATLFPAVSNPIILGFHNIGDVTGDGKDDFVTMVSGGLINSQNSYLFTHTGTGYQFNQISLAYGNSAVSLGDINGDGLNDFAAHHINSNTVKLFLGYRSPDASYIFAENDMITFTDVSSTAQVSAFGFRLASGDFTGNGYTDLIIGAFRSGTTNSFTEGDEMFWLFRGDEWGLDTYSSKAIKISANDLDPLRAFVPVASEFMSITGLIQTLPDLNGDGSDELLITSNFGSNALILMGGVDLTINETNYGTDFGDEHILLQAPNRRTGLGHTSNISNSRFYYAVGDFDNDGVIELILPQPFDPNFRTTPVYKYILDIEQIEIPSLLEIVSIEDVEGDQGGWVRIHVGGLIFDLAGDEYEFYPSYAVWRKTASNQWVHVTTVPYLADGARFAEVAVPRTLPTGATPDDSNSFVFKLSTVPFYNFYIPLESVEVRGWALDNIAPAKVTGLMAKELQTDIELRWNPSFSHDLKHYVVHRMRADGSMDLANPVKVTAETQTLIPKHLLNGQETQFVVVAMDIHNNKSEASLPVLTSIDADSGVPLEFALMQNYPNPFNPTTAIRYQVAQSSHVLVEVYDVVGRRVAQLVNETMPVGSYTVNFDASTLSSGVYIVRMQAGGFVDSRKMVLMK